MNSQDYIDVLEANLLSYLQSLPQHQLTLQQDNASIQVMASVKTTLKDAMAREWNAIPRSTIKKLVASMLSQIFDVISRQGQTTKH
ncbi:unnamed protein product, partial [Mesorhabditis belari]|uniref:Uncharacterized protein n=1 Tax=Mesorhabditis belari TaxID=2138241 RepID=A0AAF3FAG2_9BILA